MAGKPAKPKDVEKAKKLLKEYFAESKKAKSVKKSNLVQMGKKLKEEKNKLKTAFSALAAGPDA